MRERLENILFTKLKASLPAEFKTMLVRGHSTNDRHIPYISLDVGELRRLAICNLPTECLKPM